MSERSEFAEAARRRRLPPTKHKDQNTPPTSRGRWLGAVFFLIASVLGAKAPLVDDETVARIQRGEQLHAEISAQLGRLSDSVLDLQLPNWRSRALFAPTLQVVDLEAVPAAADPSRDAVATEQAWPVAVASRAVPATTRLWRPLFDGLERFEHAGFVIGDSAFVDNAEQRFRATLYFEGRGLEADGEVVGVRATVKTVWHQDEGDGWRIHRWSTAALATVKVPATLFEDALRGALPDAEQRARVQRSIHEEELLQMVLDPEHTPPRKPFSIVSGDRHPGISVVDIDRDGHDDLYVMARRGRNQLLRNRGDGTFIEQAAVWGLDIEHHTSSAIFADFDNDGDLDAFLGRTLAPSLYLVQEQGRFVPRDEWIDGRLPSLVSSVSAVDDNGDGLLDLYVSTYAAFLLTGDLRATRQDAEAETLLADHLPKDQVDALLRMARPRNRLGSDRVRNWPGPPNILYRNLGNGRFAPVAGGGPLDGWKNTFQSTWADYDRDGDADVYLANDFAPNILLRNDGDGTFVDVTAASETADLGFGMGASWGDYDGDGWQDLYVSNMYSKAGRRILARAGRADGPDAALPRGNSLLRNRPDASFERVSGLEPPALEVEKAGWSWGGQWADFDNDRNLDIYVLNGFYTAPAEVAIAEDT